ncbi:MAG: PAS domain S-box protein [Cyanobacteria bacterium REEB459]|nr:PAS domain S-box protein [Cyanobacteria bacterium REEB459]
MTSADQAAAEEPLSDPLLPSHCWLAPEWPPLLVQLLEGMAAPVCLKDRHHRWLLVNRAYADLLGYRPEDLLGRSEADVLPAAQAQSCREAEERVWQRGIDGQYPLTWPHPDGNQRILWVNISRVQENAAPPCLILTLRDLTWQCQAEQELKQQAEREHLLKQQVTERTEALQTALEVEASLKRISDRVRDSLDVNQIMLTAVQELTEALGAKGSNTALYNLEQRTSTIYYEYNSSNSAIPAYQGRVLQMDAFPEVYNQLLRGQYAQFCSMVPNPDRGYVAMLSCPIVDDRGILGDLWLINGCEYGFNDIEIRLVQQVANQCAIAIRQARLYEAAQSQVKELERLNTLKDDFLSTVSHELRTPVTTMRVALQLLGVHLNQAFNISQDAHKPKADQNRLARYFHILQEECEREISLINDLLDLQRLDMGSHTLQIEPVMIRPWLLSWIDSFVTRAKSRDQTLEVATATALPVVHVDRPSLERVLAELLNNACKYTPPGGRITLQVRAVPNSRDSQVEFILTNTGVTIPPQELNRIFDKFYRVPSADRWKQGGTGLGLALVKGLVSQLGGAIGVTSDRQVTCFKVVLPTQLALAPQL